MVSRFACKLAVFAVLLPLVLAIHAHTQNCPPRPLFGSVAVNPYSLTSSNGILSQDLTIRNNLDFEGIEYYCCNNQNIAEAPAPQADPGARTLLSLGNGINAKGDGTQSTKPSSDPRPGILTSAYTNLHFHRLNVPPTCHQEASAPLGTTAIGWTMRIPA